MAVAQAELDLLKYASEETDTICYQSCECDYAAIFASHLTSRLFPTDLEASSLPSYLANLDDQISKAAGFLRPIDILAHGVALLSAFLQVNYTGPQVPSFQHDLLPSSLSSLPSEILHGFILEDLVVDGERPYTLVESPLYLLLADRIISHPALQTLESQLWWNIRVKFVLQSLLDDPVSTIHNIICDEDTSNRIAALVAHDSELQARWHLELAHYYSFYSYDQKALFQVKEAQAASGLLMQVSGALGRRTKFQTFDVSQLVVMAKSLGTSATLRQTTGKPIALDLNDDTLLESVSFTNTNEEAEYSKRYTNPAVEVISPEGLNPELAALDPGNQPQLSLIDQCILITNAGVIKVSAASDDMIILEQVAAYIARVLQTKDEDANLSNWSINSSALLTRTRIEGHRSRTVERSVLQLQALVDQLVDEIGSDKALPRLNGHAPTATLPKAHTASFLSRPEHQFTASARERLSHIFCLPLASKWDMQRELAGKYTSIGLVRSALEIFERLESWENIAMCYGVMDQEDKAESILREQIALAKPGSDMKKLWCLLGDVTQDPAHWQTSWTVSGNRYARAQRALGKYYYSTEKAYGKALEAYSLSLKINPLNHGAWFIYGCAALELASFEVAAEAFTRCISIDQTDSESWNNLASSLLRLGRTRHRDAWKALRTATGLKYESWRMWENYMLVSLDVGEPSEALRAMRRCIELRPREDAIDIDVLRALVQLALDQTPDHEPSRTEHESTGTEDADKRAELASESTSSGTDPDHISRHTQTGPRTFASHVYTLFTTVIEPLITHDARLWTLLARLHLSRTAYAASLSAHERAFRCLVARNADVESNVSAFEGACEAVSQLVDAYRSLGPMEGRMGPGTCVMQDWKFKARSVVRTLKGRGKNFEETDAYAGLNGILEDLKNT